MNREIDRDGRLAWGATLFLFILGASPLLFCDVPPLEDLPAHLATVVVIKNLAAYPDFIFHGFFKTNATLFLFLNAAGESSLVLASKVFVALTIFAHAWVFPRLVIELGGRDRVWSATFFAAPLVHSWFVAMGMLDYALGSALALVCLLFVVRQSKDASRARAVAIGATGILVWYTHVFALGMVLFLGAIEAVRVRRVAALKPFAPLAPAAALALWSVIVELVRAHAPSVHAVVYRPPWETAYELWAKYAWSFSRLEIASLATTAALGIALVRDRKRDVPIFSTFAACVLLVVHFAAPSEAFDWFAVNSRVLPFLYAIALVRVPALPKFGVFIAATISCVWSAGLALDYARLDRDFKIATSGAAFVPEGADLFPVIFDPKGSSENTWALLNVWGMYVVDRHTSAPLLFAHSPSFPLGYKTGAKNALADSSFAQEPHDQATWRKFGESLATRGWILEWGWSPPDMIEPPAHVLAFENGKLRIYRPE